MISIIMPMYNSSKWIIEALISIKNQTYTNFECIIIDDGSTDNSIELTRQFVSRDTRFRLIKRPKDLKKGPSSCRNYACSLAKGNYIQFFDSDDIMHPHHLMEKISNIKDSDFVVCKLQEFHGIFDYNLFKTDSVPDILKCDNVFKAFICGNFPMMMVAPMWKIEVLEKHLPFNENLHILEDHELYSRILYEFNRCSIVNKTLIYYRQSNTSSMNQFYLNLETGIDSYLKAKSLVLQLSNANCIKLAILKMILGVMRRGLAQKSYQNAEKCFTFIKSEKLAYSASLKFKIFRIENFYRLFKLTKHGDTYFKKTLKL